MKILLETEAIIEAFHVVKAVEGKELQMLEGYGVDAGTRSSH